MDEQHREETREVRSILDMEVRRTARMLPMDGPLTNVEIQDVANSCDTFLKKHNISQTKAAREMGISGGVLSQFLRGNYTGKRDTIARTVNNWLGQRNASIAAKVNVPYIATQVAEDMRRVAKFAHSRKMMAAMVLPSGAGKTMVLHVLTDELRGWYIYCDEDMNPKAFLVEVARVIGCKIRDKSAAKMMTAIIDKLRDTNRPLLLDEAHRLPVGVFSRIRTIFDRAGVPIIMAGAGRILERIDDKDRHGGEGQMDRRCYKYNASDHILHAEDPNGSGMAKGRALFSREEIKQFFDQMKIKVDDGAFDMLHALACLPNRGCLGLVKGIIDVIAASHRGRVITRREVIGTMKTLYGINGEAALNSAKVMQERLKRRAA